MLLTKTRVAPWRRSAERDVWWNSTGASSIIHSDLGKACRDCTLVKKPSLSDHEEQEGISLHGLPMARKTDSDRLRYDA